MCWGADGTAVWSRADPLGPSAAKRSVPPGICDGNIHVISPPIELMNIKPLWNFKIKACCVHIRADEWRATELFLLYSKCFFFRNSAAKPGISRPGPKKPGATEAPESQLLDPIRSLLSCLNLSDIIFRINLDFWATLPSFLGALWQIFYTHLSFVFPLYWCGWWGGGMVHVYTPLAS